MNIKFENAGDQTATIFIEISAEDYQASVNKKLKEYQHKANIPGFRPGKVPFGIIKRNYEQSFVFEELNHLSMDALYNYMNENNINILGRPIANEEKMSPLNKQGQSDFTFVFDLGLSPEFEINLTKDIEVNYYHIQVSEEDINTQVKYICDQNGSHINPEISEKGDILQGTFEETDAEGNLIENGIKNTSTFLNSRIKDEELREKFVGLKKDDKVVFEIKKAFEDFELTYILDVEKEKVENLPVHFSFTLTGIIRNQPAELGKELYDKVYPGIETEEQFLEKIKEDLSHQLVNESEEQFSYDVRNKLIEMANLTLPTEFLKHMILEFNEEKLTSEQLNQQFPGYVASLRWQLIENQITNKFDIKVTDGDIREFVKGYFGAGFSEENEESKEQLDKLVDAVMQNKDQAKQINNRLLENKLRFLFKQELSLTLKEISHKELLEMQYNQRYPLIHS